MRKNRIAVILIFLLVSLCACDQDQIVTILDRSTATPTPLATLIPTTKPTKTPTPSSTQTLTPTSAPTITASPTPTATIPSAEDLLMTALERQEEAQSYHFSTQIDMVIDAGEQFSSSFSGDYQKPELLGGLMTIKIGGFTVEAEVVVNGDDIFVTDPTSGEWLSLSDNPLLAAEMDINELWDRESYNIKDFRSVTLHNQEEIDGRSVYVVSALVPGHLFSEAQMQPETGVRIEYKIGVDDGRLYAVDMAFAYRAIDSGIRTAAHTQLAFSDYDQPVHIEIPVILAKFEPQSDADLGINYELPTDWSIVRTGDESCAAGVCPELRLVKEHDDETTSSIIITAVDPNTFSLLLEIMVEPEYEETQISSLPARWREGEGYVDGTLTLSPDRGLQISAQWADHAADGAVVRQILNSLEPASAYQSTDFKTYDLPGWSSLEIPQDWHIIKSDLPGVIAISNKDADLQQFEWEPGDARLLLVAYEANLSKTLAEIIDETFADLEFEWETEIPLVSQTINGQEAASMTARDDNGFIEQATIYLDPSDSRSLLLVAITQAESWEELGPVFNAIKESVQVQPVGPGPELAPKKTIPATYSDYIDEWAPFQFAYPTHWTMGQAGDSPVVSPLTLEELIDVDYDLNSVVIVPPETMAALIGALGTENASSAAEILELMEAWNPDSVRTSTISETVVDGAEYAAAHYAATDETNDDQPIYGFIGAVTDGEFTVGMMSWVDDPAFYVEAWPNIFNSIRFMLRNDLDRRNVTRLDLGQWHDGTLSGAEEKLLAFDAAAGEEYMLITRTDGVMQQEIYDSWNWRIGQNYQISEAWPEMRYITSEENEEFILSNRSGVGDPVGFSSIAIELAEDAPGVVGLITAEFEKDECREYGYAGATGEKLIVGSTIRGSGSEHMKLLVEMLDPDHELIGGNESYIVEGDLGFFDLDMPEDGTFIMSICEWQSEPASFELVLIGIDDR